jgi:PEP-CTERM motif
MIKPIAAFAGLAAALLATAPANAALIDPTGDFLDVYTGPQNGDLDVTAVDAVLTGSGSVTLSGTHAAAIGTTAGAAYVWGIDRGAGTEPFPTLDPPTGEGVFFDSVVVLLPDGTGFFLDLTVPGGPQFLAPEAIDIDGGTIRVMLTDALLTSRGFDFADYRYNLWPRFAPGGVNPADNTQVSDFAPDADTFAARVPEPAAVGLLGLGLLGLGLRRRAR